MGRPELRGELRDYLRPKLKALDCLHETSWILDFVLKEEKLSLEAARATLDQVVERKKKGEPLAYIFSSWSFRSYEYFVGPGALIPRPETEEMVESVIMAVENSQESSKRLMNENFHVADLGAGSGCIGLSLVMDLLRDLEEEGCSVRELSRRIKLSFVERSAAARGWLEKNIAAYREQLLDTRVEIQACDWNDATLEGVDLFVSNPPYVSAEEYAELDASVKDFEPQEALLCESPSKPYEDLFRLGKNAIKPGGWFFAEIGPAQGESLQELLVAHGGFNDVRTLKDMAKKARILCARKSNG